MAKIKRLTLIIIISCLVFALAAGGSVFAIVKSAASSKAERILKAEQSKTFITELFHDQGADYMQPLEPAKGEKLTLRLRTKRYNVTRAQIQYTSDKGVTWKSVDMKYDGIGKSGSHDMWKGSFTAEGDIVYYRFIVSNEDSFNTVYYDTKKVDVTEGQYKTSWQVVPGHKTPDWAKGALWYSALPDAFYNGNTTNDKQTSGNNTYLSWNKLRRALDDKYGGDLQGLKAKLDYIKELGADALYINPIHKSYQNAGYGPVRYDEVESSFGNEADLINLANAAHERGLKLMGDVVLTFSLANSYYFNSGEYWPIVGAGQSKESPYFDMFKFFDWPKNFMVAWNSPAIDLSNDITQKVLYNNKDSYLTRYASVFDGYRFDCGGWLWGTSETEDIKTVKFIKDIREQLKSVNSDFFMLSESDWTNMNTASWDGAWNISYMPKLQDYAKGLINETLMLDAMYSLEMTIPRNVALCLENMICDHDSYRVVQHDDYMYNAAVLIQMTYLGAPCIFYGEEVDYINENEEGIGTNQSFYSMDWDETNWDNTRLAFYKATAELRKEYSCVKTGVAKVLGSDINANSLTFARWDKNGAAITVTSQNEDVIELEINAADCDIKDGTVLTDWYTGAEYTVKDGKIKAEIIPGGTVIVTGGKSSRFRQAFEGMRIGGASKRNSVLARNTSSFTLNGRGKIDSKSDKITFMATPVYNDFGVYANLRGKGSAALMIRESEDKNSPYYAATVKGEKLIISARKAQGKKPAIIAEVKVDKNTYVKLVRASDNSFKAFTATLSGGQLSAFEEVKNSSVYIPMSSKVYYGFAPLKGEMRINNITHEQGSGRITSDSFEGKSPVSMFDGINGKNVEIKDGRLTLSALKKQPISELLTSSPEDDWSFKAELGYTAKGDSFGGIVSKQDENNFVIVGRKLIDDKPALFIGKYTNGAIDVYDYVADPAEGKNITLQLQRIGGYYSAVYSADSGKSWSYIGRLFANFSLERVGLLILGEQPLCAEYVSFGDSINDGSSVNTPHSPTALDLSYNNSDTDNEAHYEYVSGDWSLIAGGWKQSDSKAYGIAAAVNQMYDEFYAEATLKTSGSGWSGISFGLGDYKAGKNSGYQVRYFENGTLALAKNGKVLAEAKAAPEKDGSLRVVLNAGNGVIKVYAGQNPKVVISESDTGYQKGYVAFCTDNAEGEFKNFHIGYTKANWNWVSGQGDGNGITFTTSNATNSGRQIHSIASLVGFGFTDLVFSTKITCTAADEENESAAGILLSASEGTSEDANGILIALNAKNELFLSDKGSVKASYTLPEGKRSALILGVKQGGEYKVFIEGKADPVLTYSEKVNRGGAFAIYSYNASGCFVNLTLENLQPSADFSQTATAQNWSKDAYKAFKDNLNSEESASNYTMYAKTAADFSVKNGVLVCENSTSWEAGATIIKNSYADFNMSFKLKINSTQSGWMSVGLRKNNPLGSHNSAGVSVMIGGGGNMFFFDSSEQKQYSNASCSSFKMGQWQDVSITAKGSNITVYINGEKMMSYTDTKYHEGFISFTSGLTNFEVDDVSVVPIK